MVNTNLYPLFDHKLPDYKDKDHIRCILSFKTKELRDKFLSKNPEIPVMEKLDLIPSLILILSKDGIKNLWNNSKIEQIEEDQVLEQCFLDISESLHVTEYKTSQIVFTGKGIKIGIIDDGINDSFESNRGTPIQRVQVHSNIKKPRDLKRKKLKSNNVTHGTLLANLLVNQYYTEEDVTLGICPNAYLLDVNISKQVQNNKQTYYISDILLAFDILNKKQIKPDILLIPFSNFSDSDGNDILSKACDRLSKEKVTIVCPAGNFKENRNILGTPGAASSVITVGSITKNGEISDFTPKSREIKGQIKPELHFPGESIHIPLSETNRVTITGTSGAAAIVTGFIALLKEFDPALGYPQIKNYLLNCSKNHPKFDYEKNESIRSFTLVDLFDSLKLYERPVLPYRYLLKRAIKASIEYVLILSIIFYIPLIFNLINSFLSP